MDGRYYGGKVSFDAADDEYSAVLAAFNIIASSKTPLVVIGGAEGRGKATVAFAFKCFERNRVLPGIEGCTLGDVKKLFSGCDLSVVELEPSVANKDQLAIARELELAKRNNRLSMSDIKGCGGLGPSNRDPFRLLKGMQGQASVARDIVAAAREYGRDAVCMNMVLTGGPGTGKSSFAAAFGELAMAEGVVDGPFCKVGAEELIADYAGQTAGLVKSAFDRAQGGILFIDEVYRLSETASYGVEAVNALNQLTEENRESVVVVVAGYKDRMDGFLESNPGLSSRFGFRVDFPAYDPRLLCDIFVNSFAKERGVLVDPDALESILAGFTKMSSSQGFANARSARKFFERCLVKQASCFGGGRVLSKESVDAALEDADLLEGSERKIGFF